MQDFRNLSAWEKSHRLALAEYKATSCFPSEERYGLCSQIRRGRASIPANLAEGCGRGTDADFARFVQIAIGSASELEYHLLLARDLGLLSAGAYAPLSDGTLEVKKMLAALLKKLRTRS